MTTYTPTPDDVFDLLAEMPPRAPQGHYALLTVLRGGEYLQPRLTR